MMGPRLIFLTAVLLCDASFGKADVQAVSTKATGQLQGSLTVLISPAASAGCFGWLYSSQTWHHPLLVNAGLCGQSPHV